MALSVVGHSVPRQRVEELVTGQSRFASDLVLPGMLYGAILRSPHPHARLVAIHTEQARSLPGVADVVTAEDVPQWAELFKGKTQSPLALDRVRYVGDPVAAVAATSEKAARRALKAIQVDYEMLPAVFDIEEAIKAGAPTVHETVKGNIERHYEAERGSVTKGFAEAEFVVEGRFEAPAQNQVCMETKCCLASFDASEHLTVYSTISHIFWLRRDLARAFGLPESKVRCVQQLTVGGHFGSGIQSLPIYYLASLLSKRTRRPVRVTHTREEDFVDVRPQMPTVIYMKLGAKKNGLFTAKETRVLGDAGAYFAPVIASILSVVMIRHENLYRFENIKTEGDLVFTNRVPTGEFRGFGNPQGHFAMESLIDRLAEKIGMDPAEMRLKNAIRSGDISVHGWDMKSSGLTECIEKAMALSNWKEKRAHKVAGRGLGMASAIHVAAMKTAGSPVTMAAGAIVKVNDDGSATVITGDGDTGQGASTVLSQICAEALGVEFNAVAIAAADTDVCPHSSGPMSSRTTISSGNAVKSAATDARRQILEAAAHKLQLPAAELEIRKGAVVAASKPDISESIASIASDPAYKPIIGRATFIPSQPGSDPVTWYGDCAVAYSFGTDVAEVEVDPETGVVKVLSFVSARDLGKAINPQSSEGQIEGGVLMGLGYALHENLEPEKGKVIRNQLVEYTLATALDTPDIKPILVESNEPRGPFGAKGIGEIVSVPVPAAVANAVYDAVGVRLDGLPITAEKVLEALERKSRER